mmetsp:Transcript_130501/g.418423  ORF Transcript_130501/g.418423 Transcript_130501/m.418423 type:complete len:95 (+) Transcript_130501:1102-1386(+)
MTPVVWVVSAVKMVVTVRMQTPTKRLCHGSGRRRRNVQGLLLGPAVLPERRSQRGLSKLERRQLQQRGRPRLATQLLLLKSLGMTSRTQRQRHR